jgi:hypothetical protein
LVVDRNPPLQMPVRSWADTEILIQQIVKSKNRFMNNNLTLAN